MHFSKLLLARNWLLASYDAGQLKSLGLPTDHTRRLHCRNFDRYTLVGAWLPAVELRCFSLKDTDFSGANLRDAHLCCVDLAGARLVAAQLAGADLQDADLRCVNAGRADFRGANLKGAKLVAADLKGADLASADLAGATLEHADVAADQIRLARNWRQGRFSASILGQLDLPHDHNACILDAVGITGRAQRRKTCCERHSESLAGACILR
jgi:uncharacterized protein YjbI with pentapeptide repeats